MYHALIFMDYFQLVYAVIDFFFGIFDFDFYSIVFRFFKKEEPLQLLVEVLIESTCD